MNPCVPRLIALLGAALPVTAPSVAAQLHVPGDYATLQDAIYEAPPGATIVVSTPVAQEGIVIDRPLTILGDPIVNIGTKDPCFHPLLLPIELAGPGFGKVALVRVNVRQCVDGYEMPPVMAGGGFDELHVYDSTIRSSRTGNTGHGTGNAAISVTVPYVLISRSTVEGGADGIDSCPWLGFGPGMTPFLAYPAVDAPESVVTVLDSTLRGGSHNFYCCQFCACPGDLAAVAGPGGAGVVAAELLVAGGSITGGSGAAIWADSNFCGWTPNGPAFVATQAALLPGILQAPDPPALGSAWNVSFATPGPWAVLLLGVGTSPPVHVPPWGWYYLGDNLTLVGAVPTLTLVSLTVPIPAEPFLAGTEIGFQLFDASTGLSRPVLGALAP